jgi:hypothetical protein
VYGIECFTRTWFFGGGALFRFHAWLASRRDSGRFSGSGELVRIAAVRD